MENDNNLIYTKPVKEREFLFSLLMYPISLFKWASRSGTLISALFTGFGVFLYLTLPVWLKIPIAILSFILIDGVTLVCVWLFVPSFYAIFKEKQKLIFIGLTVLFATALSAVGYLNFLTANLTGTTTVEHFAGDPLQNNFEEKDFNDARGNFGTQFESDSLRIVSALNNAKSEEEAGFDKSIEKKTARISELKGIQIQSNYVIKQVKINASSRSSLVAKKKGLYSKYKAIRNDSLNNARSRMLAGITLVNNNRKGKKEIHDTNNLTLKTNHENKTTDWKSWAFVIVMISVGSALSFAMYEGFMLAVCGNKKIDKKDSNKKGLISRTWIAVSKHSKDFFEVSIVERIEGKQKTEEKIRAETAAKEEAKGLQMLKDFEFQEKLKRISLENEKIKKEIEQQKQLFESERRKQEQELKNEQKQTEDKQEVNSFIVPINRSKPTLYNPVLQTLKGKLVSQTKTNELTNKYNVDSERIAAVYNDLLTHKSISQTVRTNFNNRKRGNKDERTRINRSLRIEIGIYIIRKIGGYAEEGKESVSIDMSGVSIAS